MRKKGPVVLESPLHEGNDLKHQTEPHNHAVDVVDTHVKAIQSDMRKKAGEEITPVPSDLQLPSHSPQHPLWLQQYSSTTPNIPQYEV